MPLIYSCHKRQQDLRPSPRLHTATMRLLLIILCTTTLVQPRTEFLKCTNRAQAYGAAWLARTELLARQPLSQDKNALEYASFHILTESIRLGATALKAADDSFWVNHISGYEHVMNKRKGAEAAENSVNAMVARSA